VLRADALVLAELGQRGLPLVPVLTLAAGHLDDALVGVGRVGLGLGLGGAVLAQPTVGLEPLVGLGVLGHVRLDPALAALDVDGVGHVVHLLLEDVRQVDRVRVDVVTVEDHNALAQGDATVVVRSDVDPTGPGRIVDRMDLGGDPQIPNVEVLGVAIVDLTHQEIVVDLVDNRFHVVHVDLLLEDPGELHVAAQVELGLVSLVPTTRHLDHVQDGVVQASHVVVLAAQEVDPAISAPHGATTGVVTLAQGASLGTGCALHVHLLLGHELAITASTISAKSKPVWGLPSIVTAIETAYMSVSMVPMSMQLPLYAIIAVMNSTSVVVTTSPP